uniref:NADH-ubiquinone oxidoreductase chain 6 n=1 Tax=Amorphoscelis hainana TaxID=2803035 RepID=A0A7U3TID6_9NEOP|nr:NADH dehydrogenase subunit 6 [Amorphoscelis hainana]QQP01153.1 NADH dehydrogenase subunit 6 [Amorphoscelis hainana]
MIYTLMSVSMILSLIFMFLNHPLSMGLILFLQAILLSLISGMMSMSFWFSYILLLIYLGGMLILFLYVTSLASNEMFFYSNMFLLMIFMLPMIFMIIYLSYFQPHSIVPETMENIFNNPLNLNSSLLKMYNQPINNITLMIASYLFLTLLAVVKLINITKGPLRKMLN